jgi:hypothetical protein
MSFGAAFTVERSVRLFRDTVPVANAVVLKQPNSLEALALEADQPSGNLSEQTGSREGMSEIGQRSVEVGSDDHDVEARLLERSPQGVFGVLASVGLVFVVDMGQEHSRGLVVVRIRHRQEEALAANTTDALKEGKIVIEMLHDVEGQDMIEATIRQIEPPDIHDLERQVTRPSVPAICHINLQHFASHRRNTKPVQSISTTEVQHVPGDEEIGQQLQLPSSQLLRVQ